MLKANPDVRRQLPEAGPAMLWRERRGAGREGLVLATQACAEADCSCREIVIEGWSVTDALMAASVDGASARFVYSAGAGSADEKVLVTGVDIDSGKMGPVEGAANSKQWAVEWLASELDSELLEFLRRRFAAAKTLPGAPPDWRREDWSWWEPGMDVGWLDVHVDEAPLEVTVGGRTYSFADFYCVEPGCSCEEVRWYVTRVGERDEEVGEVSVNPKYPTAAQLLAHGAVRQELGRAWAALTEREPMPALLFGRSDEMRGHAGEIHRLFAKQGRAKVSVGRNEPCPCGSGKKFKQCCME